MLCWQLFLCSGREVWFSKVTFRGSWRQKSLSLTPLSLSEPESLPVQEGAVGGKAPCGPAQLNMWPCWIPMSIWCELEMGGGGVVSSGLYITSSLGSPALIIRHDSCSQISSPGLGPSSDHPLPLCSCDYSLLCVPAILSLFFYHLPCNSSLHYFEKLFFF